MHDDTESDAILLWSDVLALLESQDTPGATIAMLKSLTPTSLTDTELHVATGLSFAQRKIERMRPDIEQLIEQVAFQRLDLCVDFDPGKQRAAAPVAVMAAREIPSAPTPAPVSIESQPTIAMPPERRRQDNPLFEEVPEGSSRLTFDRFISGEQNILAFDAAKQVADGSRSYNPLFIYGKSGLGKTHLLRAIQNYIIQNDPTRICVYRSAGEFVDEYVKAARSETSGMPRSALMRHYQDVDVLIIDDIQNMSSAAGSIRFFFETFNYLTSHGKQVVLAADRMPSQLAMGDSHFDERDTSRMDSGVTVSIQVPDYELKLNLINAFYERMKADAATEHVEGLDATIDPELRKLMAERSGANIRIIEAFVQSCLMLAYRREKAGESLTREDVIALAAERWSPSQRVISIEQIQRAVEQYYHIDHAGLVGSRRNKEFMEPRHTAIWLSRELTDNTLADIGKHFGGRSHATIKHSIAWVDELRKENRLFYDRITALRDQIVDGAHQG